MQKTKKKKDSLLSRIFSIIGSVIVVLLIFGIGYLMICNATNRVAFVGKYALIKIVSPSMEPVIPTGEYILVEKISSEDVSVDDVIVFYSRDQMIYGKLNTHRVVAIDGAGDEISFVTKGDNNNVSDAVQAGGTDVVGRYIRNIPVITSVADFFSNKTVFLLLIVVPAGILLLICIVDVIKRYKEAKLDAMVAAEVERMKSEDAQKDKGSDIDNNDTED